MKIYTVLHFELECGTCSVLPAENELQTEWFLNTFSEFEAIPVMEIWQQVIGTNCPFTSNTAQFFPHTHGTDGFFVSIFKRKS